MFNTFFKSFLLAFLAAAIATTTFVALNGDPMGWIGCFVFTALLVFTVAMLLFEQHSQFHSKLVKINSLDLTNPGRAERWRIREAFEARHR
jgi:hypothetical protein